MSSIPMSERRTNKEFGMKTNLFINKAEPQFVDSMARTMDSFNHNLSTLGGKAALEKEENKRIDPLLS